MARAPGIPNLTADQKAEIVRLHGQWWSDTRIAAHMGLHHSTVSSFMRRFHPRTLTTAQTERLREKVVHQHIDRLTYVAEAAMRDYEHSRKPKLRKIKRTAKRTGMNGYEHDETQFIREMRDPNPAFLDKAMAAMKDVRSLVGVGSIDDTDVPHDEDNDGEDALRDPVAQDLAHDLYERLDAGGTT